MRATLVALVLAFATGAMADTVTVTATLGYRERIALPSAAVVLAELRDGDGRLLGESRTETAGAQVPLAVSVTAADPAEVLVLQAAILGPGAPWVTDAVVLPRGARDAGTLVARRALPAGPELALRCGPDLFWITRTDGGTRLRHGGATVRLLPDPAASGAKSVAPDDSGTWAWSKGPEITLSWRGVSRRACVPALDRLAAGLSARGTEPFWRLDIAEGALDFALLDGAALRRPRPLPDPTATGLRYAATDLVVTLDADLVHDAMSGMPYPVRVTVETPEGRFTGAGGDPADLLEGLDWRVSEAGGQAFPKDTDAWLRFEGRRVSGHGGCNGFSGSFDLTGEALRFGPTAATMKACPGAQMAAERAFFAALAETRRFDIGADGALVLLGDDGPVGHLLP